MDLSPYYNSEPGSPGSFLREGDHLVKVMRATEDKFPDKGAPFMDFFVQNRDGEEIKMRFYTTDKALTILTQFLKACGLPQNAFKDFQPEHLVGYKVNVRVIRDPRNPKYHTVDTLRGYWPVGAEAPPPEAAAAPRQNDFGSAPVRETTSAPPKEADAIPF